MTLLSHWASNTYSQTGEDGVLQEIVRRLGEGTKVSVEFGAGDGVSCSNTRNLWRHQGWKAVLIEADGDLYKRMVANLQEPVAANVTAKWAKVETSGSGSIDGILTTLGIQAVDFMSIDVDGDDYWIFAGMEARPRIVSIEFNKTIPVHLDVRPRGPGNRMGVGLLTIKRTAEQKGYRVIGATDANAWLVRTEDAGAFADIDVSLPALLPADRLMYLATDYDGRIVPMGTTAPPWGLMWPPSPTNFVMNQDGLLDVEDYEATGRILLDITRTLARIEGRLP